MLRLTQQHSSTAVVHWLIRAVVLAHFLVGAALAAAQNPSEDWLERCRDNYNYRGDREVHCEVREVRLPASGSLSLNARPNGGITVAGWDQNEVLVRARIQANARTASEAREMASQVRIETEGSSVRADGPSTRGWREDWWSVSYEVFVPRRTNLELESVNGGIRITDVQSQMNLSTSNGAITLDRVGGNVRGETSNGGVRVSLTGNRWEGEGLDLRTSNGSVTVEVPQDYSAHLVTGTVNGGFQTDFPITVQGRIGRRLETDLGRGGAPIRVTTTNGGVRIRRR